MICALKMQLLRSELSQSLAASSDLRGRLLTMENARCYFYSHCARSDLKSSYFNSCLLFRHSSKKKNLEADYLNRIISCQVLN